MLFKYQSFKRRLRWIKNNQMLVLISLSDSSYKKLFNFLKQINYLGAVNSISTEAWSSNTIGSMLDDLEQQLNLGEGYNGDKI